MISVETIGLSDILFANAESLTKTKRKSKNQ